MGGSAEEVFGTWPTSSMGGCLVLDVPWAAPLLTVVCHQSKEAASVVSGTSLQSFVRGIWDPDQLSGSVTHVSQWKELLLFVLGNPLLGLITRGETQ